MEEMKLKTSEIVNAYQVLAEASYEKMADEDKIKVWKIARELKPIALKFEEDRADAQRKLIPDAEFNQRLQKARDYEKLLSEGKTELPMTAKEYQEFVVEFKNKTDLMKAALTEYADAEVEVNINLLSEDAFSKLMASNNWTLKQVDNIAFIVNE